MPTNLPSKPHWEQVYSSKSTDAVSWYQPHADLSMQMVEAAGVAATAAIIENLIVLFIWNFLVS